MANITAFFFRDAIVKTSPTQSFTLDARATLSGTTARTSSFFLSAEITAAAPNLTFTSPNSRNLHDRLSMHYGMGSAGSILLSQALGSVPAGATLEEALRLLWNLMAVAELPREWFYLDAVTDEDVFWRDTFERTVAVGLGSSTSRSAFGQFPWQRLDGGTHMAVSVDGHDAEFVGDTTSQLADFIGYPTFTEGELRFDFYAPPAGGGLASWEIRLAPWRDDITDVICRLQIEHVFSNWDLFADFTPPVAPFDGSQSLISAFHFANTPAWYSVKFKLSDVGGEIACAIWARDTEPEPDWADVSSATLPDTNTGHRWVAVGSGVSAYSDDATTWTENDVPPFAANAGQDICWGLAFGVPTWFAVGSLAGYAWSRDGVSWTQDTSDHHFPAGTVAGFTFCVTDGAGTWLGINITDAHPWRAIGDPATSFWNQQSALPSAFRKLCWGNGLFLALGQNDARLDSSPDGATWTPRTSGLVVVTDWLQDGVFGGGQWLLVGGDGSGGATGVKVTLSADGLTWTEHTIAALNNNLLAAVTYGNGYYVACGFNYDDDSGIIAYSTDGVSWTLLAAVSSVQFNDIGYADGVFVAVDNDGGSWIATDPTGTWTLEHTATGSATLWAVVGRHAVDSRETPMFEVNNDTDTVHPPLLIDYIKTFKTDSDPARLYHAFSLDAYTSTAAIVQMFTSNAIVRASRSSTKTLDAIVRAKLAGTLALDAIAKVARSATFTLDASVPGGGASSFVLDALIKAMRSATLSLDAYINRGPLAGGTFSEDATYWYWAFTGNGTLQHVQDCSADIFRVAGGGGGCSGAGGGGGAGGILLDTAVSITSDLTIVVGTGGAGSTSNSINGTNGGDTTVTGLTTVVGGGGGGKQAVATGTGSDGGSGGGGGGRSSSAGGHATSGQGHDGGVASTGTTSANLAGGGGGGGSTAGGNVGATNHGGNGGDGSTFAQFSSWGVSGVFGGGGGGGGDSGKTSPLAGAGGTGGGGHGGISQSGTGGTQGTDGTGSGGGAGGFNSGTSTGHNGFDGGDGIVIVRVAK